VIKVLHLLGIYFNPLSLEKSRTHVFSKMKIPQPGVGTPCISGYSQISHSQLNGFGCKIWSHPREDNQRGFPI
jgi:hypothetical protein